MKEKRRVVIVLCLFVHTTVHLTLVSMSTDCYSGLEDKTCQKNTNSNSIFYNKSCMAIDAVCSHFGYFNGGNTTHCFQNSGEPKAFSDIYNRTLSSEEYFRYDISCHQRCIVSRGSGTSLTSLFSVEERDKICSRSRLQSV